MKKKIFLIIVGLFLLTGCTFNLHNDNMKDITIYTTIYPIKYLINSLYGENSTIYSIYPSGVEPSNFELSNKKLTEYANTDLFVFNSLDRDRDFAVDMINKNKKLKVIDVSMGMNYDNDISELWLNIDVSMGMNYDNDISELWLNPYNYLMMAQNTKDGLLEYISNPYLISNTDKTGVEDKYEELKYDLSRLDADIKENISHANYKTIVVDNDVFKFLEKYNLKVISLEENDSLSENTINEVKKLINNGSIKYIFSIDSETNDTCKNLINNYNIELVTINAMKTIDGGISNSNENYITVMNNNIDLLNKELYK